MENSTEKEVIRLNGVNGLFALSNILYFVAAVLFMIMINILFSQEVVSQINNYLLNPLLLLSAFFLPLVVYLKKNKLNYKTELRLNKLNYKYVIPLVILGITSQFIGMFLNNLVVYIIQIFGDIASTQINIPQNFIQLILLLISVAVFPAIFEELFIRGVIFSQYKRITAKYAIIITAVLFAIMHFDIKNFLFPLFFGIILGYVVHKTNSIYSGIIVHFINNTLGVLFLYIFKPQQTEYLQRIDSFILFNQLIIALIAIIFMSISLYYIARLSNRSLTKVNNSENTKFLLRDFWPILISISIYFVIFLGQIKNLIKI